MTIMKRIFDLHLSYDINGDEKSGFIVEILALIQPHIADSSPVEMTLCNMMFRSEESAIRWAIATMNEIRIERKIP